MKNIISLAIALTLGFSSLAMATRPTPKGSDGASINHPLYGGADYVRLADTTETLVCSGRCLLLGLVRATGATTAEVWLRDTAAADGAAQADLRINYGATSSTAYDNPIAFPMVFRNGITVDQSAANVVYVLYVDLSP